MTDFTTIVNHHLWGDTSAPDIYRTIQIYGDASLLETDVKGLMRALRFGSVKSTQNFLDRTRQRGRLSGEVGSLHRCCAWLLALTALPTPPSPAEEPPRPLERQPRPVYPSDMRRRQRQNGHASTPQPTPQALRSDSAAHSAPTPPEGFAESHTRARETVSVTVPLVVSNETNGNGSVGFLNKTENEPTETERTGGGLGEPSGAASGLRLAPQCTPTEQMGAELIAVGFSVHDADLRLRRHPAERIRDALEELAYRDRQKPITKKDGFVAKFLDQGWSVSAAVQAERQARQQAAMPLLSVSEAVRSEPLPEPCTCPPPKEMLAAVKAAIGRHRGLEDAPTDEAARRAELRAQAETIERREAECR